MVIAQIAPGSFNIPRQSPLPVPRRSFFSYPAAFRARKLPSHVGEATNHVRRIGGGRAREGRSKVSCGNSAKDVRVAESCGE